MLHPVAIHCDDGYELRFAVGNIGVHVGHSEQTAMSNEKTVLIDRALGEPPLGRLSEWKPQLVLAGVLCKH